MASFDELMTEWEKQKTVRDELGDRLDVARVVDQVLVFRNRSAAERAAEALVKRGYEVGMAKSLFRTEVRASRLQTLTDEDVHAFTEEMTALAVEFGGAYDGFGSEVAAAGN